MDYMLNHPSQGRKLRVKESAVYRSKDTEVSNTVGKDRAGQTNRDYFN